MHTCSAAIHLPKQISCVTAREQYHFVSTSIRSVPAEAETSQKEESAKINRSSTGYLILRLASRLDAFSGYPIRT